MPPRTPTASLRGPCRVVAWIRTPAAPCLRIAGERAPGRETEWPTAAEGRTAPRTGQVLPCLRAGPVAGLVAPASQQRQQVLQQDRDHGERDARHKQDQAQPECAGVAVERVVDRIPLRAGTTRLPPRGQAHKARPPVPPIRL